MALYKHKEFLEHSEDGAFDQPVFISSGSGFLP